MGEAYFDINYRRRVSIMLLAGMLTLNIVLFLMNVISTMPFWITVGIVGLIALQRS